MKRSLLLLVFPSIACASALGEDSPQTSAGSPSSLPELIVGFKPLLSTADKNSTESAESDGWTSVTVNYYTFNLNVLVGYRL